MRGGGGGDSGVFPPSASALFSFISLSLLFGLFHSLFLTYTSIHQTSFLYHAHTTHTHTRLFAHQFLLSLSTTQDFLVYN